MKQPQYPIYYPVTQSMANLLSEESRARLEKYSNFQALLNSFAKVQDDLGNKLSRYARNTNIETFDLNTLDLLYSVDKSVDLSSVLASGVTCTKTDKSTIEEWAYDSEPDSVYLTPSVNYDLQGYSIPYISPEFNIATDILMDNRIAIQCKYYNSIFQNSSDDPFYDETNNTLNSGMYILNYLDDKYFTPYIKILIKNSGPILFNNDPNTPFDITSVTLYGLDDNFMPQEETIGFLYNSTKRSSKKWRLISAYTINLPNNVRQYAIENNGTIQVSILHTSGIYSQTVIKDSIYNGSFPDQYIEDPLYRYYDQENKEYTPLFYKFRTWSGVSFIVEKYILDRYDINRYVLVDKIYVIAPTSTKIIAAIPSEYSEKFYIIDSAGSFLWFDRRQQYSSASKFINLRTQDPIVNIDYFVEHTEGGTFDSVLLKGNYNRLRASQTITKYRFVQIDKYGNRSKILYEPSINNEYNENWITYDNSYWTDYKPKDTLGFLSPVVKCTYEFETGILLEVMTESGYIHADYIVLDAQIVRANYLLNTVFYGYLYRTLYNVGLNEDTHGALSILFGTSPGEQVDFKIKFIYNTYFETDNKRLFLSKAVLSEDNDTDIIVHNVYNELDQLAALIGIERFEGESNAILLKRIDHINKYPISSSRNGIINALAAYTNNYHGLAIMSTVSQTYFEYSFPKFYYGYSVNDAKEDFSYVYNIMRTDSQIQLASDLYLGIFRVYNLSPNTSYYALDYSNRVYLNNLRIFENLNHFIVDHTTLRYNQTIKSITIKNFTRVNTKEELSSTPKSYYYELRYNNLFRMMAAEVFTSEPLSYYDTIDIIALNHIILPESKFNALSSYDVESNPLSIGISKIYASDFIEKSETIYPTKWS